MMMISMKIQKVVIMMHVWKPAAIHLIHDDSLRTKQAKDLREVGEHVLHDLKDFPPSDVHLL